MALVIAVYLVLPIVSDFSNLNKELEMREREALAIENYYKDVHDNFNKLKEHQETLEKIDSALPVGSFMPSLFNYLQKTSTENGVFLRSVNLSVVSKKKTGEETTEKIHEEYVNIELIGFYDGFENFLKSIEKSSRLIEVEEVQIRKEGEKALAEGMSALNLLLKVYSY